MKTALASEPPGTRIHKVSRPMESDSSGWILLDSGRAAARIALHGAHLMSLRAGKSFREVLWTGPYHVRTGQDCWGGIPICWPWFMMGTGEKPLAPFHGTARFSSWTCTSKKNLADGSATATLALPGPVITPQGGSLNLSATLDLCVTDGLRMQLTTQNRGLTPISLEHCFHAYFLVGDITRTILHGLPEPASGQNAENGIVHNSKTETTQITGAASYFYPQFPEEVGVEDPVLRRRITLHSRHATQLVLWNSGPPREANGRPTGEKDWKTQLTLEPLRGMERSLELKPGQSAVLDMEIRVTDTPC